MANYLSEDKIFHLWNIFFQNFCFNRLSLYKILIFSASLTSNNRSLILANQPPDDPSCMAYDWNGRNIYVGKKHSQTIEVVRTQGEQVC